MRDKANFILNFLNGYHLENWSDFLKTQVTQDYFVKLIDLVSKSYEQNNLFPQKSDLFKCMEILFPTDVKVVIIGQDPYFNDNQANGLAFSVNVKNKLPPSLKNIFKEINFEYGYLRTNPDLSDWSKQGVLLLNTILTVQKYKPLSCANWGWEQFTYNLIEYLLKNNQNIVFICLGKYSQKFVKSLLPNINHYFLFVAHPSPLSANNGFFKSNIFIKTNNYLVKHNKVKVNW